MSSVLDHISGDRWKSGKIRVSNNIIKFPTALMQISNISFVGRYQKGPFQNICSIIMILTASFFIFIPDSNFIEREFNIALSILIILISLFIWPWDKYRIVIESNSGNQQIIISARGKVVDNLLELLGDIMDGQYKDKSVTINIANSKITNISDNQIEGDAVLGDKIMESRKISIDSPPDEQQHIIENHEDDQHKK